MGRWARGAAGGPAAVTRAHAAGPGTRLDPRHPPGPRPGVARGAPPAGAVPVTRGRVHRWRDAGCSGGAGLDLPGSAGPPGGKSLRGAAASGCCPEGTAALNRHRRGLQKDLRPRSPGRTCQAPRSASSAPCGRISASGRPCGSSGPARNFKRKRSTSQRIAHKTRFSFQPFGKFPARGLWSLFRRS